MENGFEVFEVDVAEVVEPEAVQRGRRLRKVVRLEAGVASLLTKINKRSSMRVVKQTVVCVLLPEMKALGLNISINEIFILIMYY